MGNSIKNLAKIQVRNVTASPSSTKQVILEEISLVRQDNMCCEMTSKICCNFLVLSELIITS